MRTLKLICIVGFVLAMSGMAGAAQIPLNRPYTGPILAHVTDYDAGPFYSPFTNPDTGAQFVLDGQGGTTPFQTGVRYAVSQLQMTPGLTPSGIGSSNESWGIFTIDQILPAHVTGFNQIDHINADGLPLYNAGDGGLEIAGMTFGRTDTFVTFNSDGGQSIESIDGQYLIYTQPFGALDPTLGSAGRTGLSTYNTLGGAGSELVISTASNPGFVVPADPNATFLSTFYANGSQSGQADTFMSVAGLGSEDFYFNGDFFQAILGQYIGTTADIRLHVTTTLNPDYDGRVHANDWLVTSSDPLTTTIIPEPLTVLGVILSIGGLGRYVRNRKLAIA